MKKLFLILAISIGATGIYNMNAQGHKGDKEMPGQELGIPYDTIKKAIIYTEVVNAPGTDKNKLYDRAMNALHKMYVQADDKIVIKDKENGKIELNGFTQFKQTAKDGTVITGEKIRYRLTILIKDGRYKYEFSDFRIDFTTNKKDMEVYYRGGDQNTDMKKEQGKEKLEWMNTEIKKLIAQLKDGMSKDDVKTKEDW